MPMLKKADMLPGTILETLIPRDGLTGPAASLSNTGKTSVELWEPLKFGSEIGKSMYPGDRCIVVKGPRKIRNINVLEVKVDDVDHSLFVYWCEARASFKVSKFN